MLDLPSIAFASTQAILQVAFNTLFGFILVRCGYLSQSEHKGLVAVNLNFFTPCILFTKMAADATLSTYLSIWPIIPIYICLVALSNLMAYLGSKALDLSSSQRRFTTLAIFFTNTNSIPLSLFLSVVRNPSVSMLFLWKEGDNLKDIEGRGMTYIMMFLSLTNLVCWSYGVRLITLDLTHQDINETTPILHSEPDSKSPIAFISRLLREFRSFLNPPLAAILAAFLVALIPPLKSFLFNDSIISIAFMATLSSCGSAAVPCLLLSLGGSLAFLLQRGRLISFQLVGYIALSRLILLPLIMGPILYFLRSCFYLGGDPTFLFVIMLILSTPTAVNSLSLCQSVRAYEDEMAMVLLFSYLIALPILTASTALHNSGF
ncbi:hypothetical protein DSO57_1038350 [Entomophthora muscae]|uniref:Uncharacterized protein n=1 Tax=Entomophthora muscae TaxID=34485 RepID=A0ACC2S0N6_9FUNG|nr:hypothetical protein DSO57_1038350 [Entomophthora muscae]